LLSSQIISTWLDYKRFTVKERIRWSFYYVVLTHVVAWVYGWVIQEKYTRTVPAFDWTDSGFTEGFFVLLLWDFSRQALQNWLYYLLSTSTDNMSELTRYCGILRGQESFGQAVAFGLVTQKWHGGRVPLGVNTVLLVLSAYPTWLAMSEHEPIVAPESPEATATATELSDADSRKEDAVVETIVQEPKKNAA